MGKNGSGSASEAGSDSTAPVPVRREKGILEHDPTERYLRYDDPLGKGAYKKVFKAFDLIDGIEVAWNRVSIDRMLQSPENLSRLYSEVHFLKTLKHENILKYYSSWVDDEKRTINIITELFTSGSLRAYRKKHNCVDMKAIKCWARQILRGLEYLHSHSPPIIHRDLKCDNIFVNGNNGEVKIGDLGLATMMLQDKARSVLGTPEFMAPELYEEEYNELVDIYSFGMCMLEMVTLDYPYSECHNAAQIFKRVTSGVKPASLEKVTNSQVREFIEKCLVPAPERKSAKELLKDPFLHCSNSHEIRRNKIPAQIPPPKSLSGASAETILLDIEAECNSDPVNESVEANYDELQLPSLEFVRINEDNEFRLRGDRQDENSIFFSMRITSCSNGNGRNVNFAFYLDSDTSLMVADEMVDQLELADYDVPFISEFIDYLIMCLVPDWRPLEEFSSGDNASTVENGSTLEHEFSFENELMLENGRRMENILSLENGSDGIPNKLSLNSTSVSDSTSPKGVCEEAKSVFGSSSEFVHLAGTSEEVKSDLCGSPAFIELLGNGEDPKSDSDSSSTSVQLSGKSNEVNANGCCLSTSMPPVQTNKDEKAGPRAASVSPEGIGVNVDCTAAKCNCEKEDSTTVPNGCHVAEVIGKKPFNGYTLQSLDTDDEEGLQSEINDIQEHYRHLFEELMRMREVAFQNAHKRWMRKMGKRPA